VLLTIKTYKTIIVLIVYVVAKLAFLLQGKNSLKMCGNKVLRIYLLLKEESHRRMEKKHLMKLYSSSIRVMKLK
jgi:hypothetical protein